MVNLQGTDTEHEQDTNLLLGREMQVPDLRDRERECDKVEEDAEGGVRKGQRVVVQAPAVVLTVPLLPGEADRRADKSCGDGESNGGCQTEENDGPYDATEALLGEDLQVKEQEGNLDEAQC